MTALASVERWVARGLQRAPKGLLRRLAGAPQVLDGQTLDPVVQVILRAQRMRRRPEMQTLSPEQARHEYATSLGVLDSTPRSMRAIEDVDADGVPARVYVPDGHAAGGGALVYLHGGGGVIGDLECCDSPVRVIADESDLVVISVDYRLAPEHPFPAALEDTRTAYRWAVARASQWGVDPARIAVGGDSYGGSLAGLLALELRDADVPSPAAQLLIYPGCDFTRTGGSRDLFAQDYLLDKVLIEWFRDHTFETEEDRIAASVLRAKDHAGAAPAIIRTAGFDPLRDEGADYAATLREAGVEVDFSCAPGQVHAYISMAGVAPAAKEALEEMSRALGAKLTS